jgi:hypothetical protein
MADQDSSIQTSTIVWNTIVPALGIALLLGASVLPAIVIAVAAAAAILAGGRVLRSPYGAAPAEG